jgi:hypothetical protein
MSRPTPGQGVRGSDEAVVHRVLLPFVTWNVHDGIRFQIEIMKTL